MKQGYWYGDKHTNIQYFYITSNAMRKLDIQEERRVKNKCNEDETGENNVFLTQNPEKAYTYTW